MLGNQRIYRRNRFTQNGLQAWWDGAALSTITRDGSNYVSQVNDKTINGRNLTQSTQANKPVYQSSGIGGLGAIAFSGSNQFLNIADGTLSFIAGSSFTIIYVATKTALSSNSYVIGGQGVSTSNNLWAGYLSANTYRFGMGTDFQSAIVTNASAGIPELYTLILDTNNSNFRRIRRNGTDVGTGAATSALAGMSGETIGRYIASYGQFSLGEMLIYNRALSTSEYIQVERDLLSKWSVPLP